ncbi:MAG: YitT family protein [Bacteroidales bacterium]|nr:YitT family protein [Bacteroidales bacterium]
MNKILSILKTQKFWSEFLTMTIGMFVAAAAVNYFLVPSKIIVGSITGLSMVLTGILESMGIPFKLSLMIFLINGILLVLAYFLIGPEFGIKTVYTALILGPMIEIWESILPASALMEPGSTSVMNDPWFDLLCFVLVLSASQAIMFRINASTGGLDILAKIINKYLHFDIGASVTIAGAIICCTAFAINPFRLVVIGLIGTWINGTVVDYFTATLNRRKRVCIISDDPERIRQYIIDTMKRGCSLYPVKGGYKGEERVEIQAILAQNEFSDLMNFIRTNDIHAFITAGNVSEVYGLWKTSHHGKDEVRVLNQ